MRFKFMFLFPLLAAIGLTATGCTVYPNQAYQPFATDYPASPPAYPQPSSNAGGRAVVGGLLGAGAGAALGSIWHRPGMGAAIGAGAGAVGGAVTSTPSYQPSYQAPAYPPPSYQGYAYQYQQPVYQQPYQSYPNTPVYGYPQPYPVAPTQPW